MFFQQLAALRERDPKRSGLVTDLDQYLGALRGKEQGHIQPRIVAKALHADVALIVQILAGAVETGVLQRKYRYYCPVTSNPVRDYRDLSAVSDRIECSMCDEGPHPFDARDFEIVFEIVASPNLSAR